MKRLVLSAAVLALGAGMGMAQQVVRIGTEGAYPPYNMINDRNEVDGFERELGDELCKRAGLTCEWVVTDWDSIILNLNSGNYDAIMAGMSVTAERKESIAFTQGYFPPAASAYAGVSADADLDGVIAAQTGTIQANHVAETGATLMEFPVPEDTVAAVRNGEADAVLADKEFLVPIVAESGGALVFVGEDVFLDEGIGVGLRKSDSELREKFDAAITSMKEDGTLNPLIKKWFGEEAQTF
ncbi:transporter substrate-binding domain-containing protein [Ruixingdingia sedimenti]|uniref:Transporter substrate-binding domain-containing protein n=1 Tax=Ruixingdingia sedimenti TaxID=3073604 RepID=A0ABU1FFK4_9RHOB|nr:transporter substrate-binding domain-containing protein [Xinfangfangia sp. LG-4]MDR5655172.1 transporter substrate-binding domain-containing protein [Xinfangfangia sp. LG-4]